MDFPQTRSGSAPIRVEDEFTDKVSEDVAFIGIGQGGNRVVSDLWDAGYRRVLALNTAQQDLNNISVPESHQLWMDIGTNGAGRDMALGEKAFSRYYDQIFDRARRVFGDSVGRIYVCACLGGGTGTGGFILALKLAREYLDFIHEQDKRPGVVVALPRREDGARERQNANHVLQKLIPMVRDERSVSPMIVLDNEVAHGFFKESPITKYWGSINSWFVQLFHAFNVLSARNTDMDAFDGADYRRVLNSGVVSFGATQVDDYMNEQALSERIQRDMEGSVLFRGFTLKDSDVGGLVVEASEKVMDELPMKNVTYAHTFILRNMRENATLLKGVYVRPGDDSGKRLLSVYYIFGGLSFDAIAIG